MNTLFTGRQRAYTDSFPSKAELIWLPGVTYYDNPQNAFVFFTRDFSLKKEAQSVNVKIFTDSRYMLHVNGHYIGRGPCRSDPRWQYYDIHDVTEHIHAGENTVGVLVLYYGYGTGQSIPRIPCLCAEIEINYYDEIDILPTDKLWKCIKAECYKSGPRVNGRQGPMEIFDARLYPQNWASPGFNRNGWEDAASIWLRDRHPFYHITERTIPLLREDIFDAGKPVYIASIQTDVAVSMKPDTDGVHDIFSTIRTDLNQLLFPDAEVLNKKNCLTVPRANVFLYDFKKIHAGYPILEAAGESGAIIDVVYAEYIFDGKITFHEHNRPADRFILRQGRNSLETAFGWKAFRYLLLIIRGSASIIDIKVRSRRYPLVQTGSFECSNDTLNFIRDISLNTIKICMQDGFVDSPSREQQQWIGDGRWQAIIAWQLSPDRRLQKKLLEQIGQSQDWTGMVKARHPDDHNNIPPIPSFGLAWVNAFADYELYTGDSSMIIPWWPNLVALMRWFTAYEDENNMLTDVPHWSYIDWGESDTNRGGIVCALNLMYIEAMHSMTYMAGLIHANDFAEYYTHKAKILAAAVRENLWDDENGFYCDCLVNKELSPKASEPANALALLFLHNKNDERARRIIEKIFIKQDAGTRSYVRTSPYLQTYTARALKKHGRSDTAYALLKKNYHTMVSSKAVSAWERWEIKGEAPDSASHGWCAQPLIFFNEVILGIKPLTSGFKTFEFSPDLLDLPYAKGIIPTPYGLITVELSRDASGNTEAKICSPEGVQCIRHIYREFEQGGIK
ncbi:MAG: glycoside hydrolase family 78 protein [Treponema sp.]|nr:glycoside hydrolase family 78 protein [Treponema sp.]